MFCQFFVFFLVAFEDFFGTEFYGTLNIDISFGRVKRTLYNEKRLFETDVLSVDAIQVRFTNGQVMHSIKDISFAGSIVACKAIHRW